MTDIQEHDEVGLIASGGGWTAPSETIYDVFPEVTARRGGLSFTPFPTPLADMSKKDLIARLEALQKRHADLGKISDEHRRKRQKAEKKNKRLLKIILGLA